MNKTTVWSGWFYAVPVGRGFRIPPHEVHFFKARQDVSICGKFKKKSDWKKVQQNQALEYNKEKLCPVCLKHYNTKIYVPQEQISSNDVQPLLIKNLSSSPHHFHFQTCFKCGTRCMYLSNDEKYVIRERQHIGCEVT